MDRKNPLPLYVQVKEQLAQLITTTKKGNELFYTDEELVQLFRVSRVTIREAVRQLVSEGYLYRMRGVGTFVTERKLVGGDENRLTDYVDLWTAQGKQVFMEVLNYQESTCPRWAAELLGLGETEAVLSIRRLRKIDRIPLALDERILPLEYGRLLPKEQLNTTPIFKLLAAALPSDPPAWVNFCIEGATAAPTQASALQIETGDPLLVRSYSVESRAGLKLSAGRSYFRADLTKWNLRLPVLPHTSA